MPATVKTRRSLFRPVRDSSVSARVTEAIRQAIFSGQLLPGDPLLEMQLAREFEVSQTSVREALLRLERVNLVKRTPNKGTVVVKLTPDEVRERYDIRVPLEELAAVEASRHLTGADVEELQRRVRRLSADIMANAYFEAAQSDLAFHGYIWELSGNRTLALMLDQLTGPAVIFVSIMRSRNLEDLSSVVHSHQEIVAALESHDADRIRASIRAHFESSYDQFKKES
jgi:DNA-binding GntR family transcriptional regulator